MRLDYIKVISSQLNLSRSQKRDPLNQSRVIKKIAKVHAQTLEYIKDYNRFYTWNTLSSVFLQSILLTIVLVAFIFVSCKGYF